MSNLNLDKPIVRMPEFASGRWLNTQTRLDRAQLRGKVVLVDFWDFTCVNCVRTLPYLKAWHERYSDLGLVIVGVHAPEFGVGKIIEQVKAAVDAFGLAYPVLLDNEYETWDRFANKAWPSKHLIDAGGYVRMRRQGEGYYEEIEQGIRQLLGQLDHHPPLPDPVGLLRREDEPGTVCYRPTPELHAGYQGGGLFGGALGNSEGYVKGSPMVYTLPPPAQRAEGHFYLEGFWRAEPQAMVFAGQAGGRVVVPYRAATANAVLSPTSDQVELILGLRATDNEPEVDVRQDGRHLAPVTAGEDIHFEENGRSFVRPDRLRLMQLVHNRDFTLHELELVFRTSGIALFSISFTGCPTDDGAAADDAQIYQVK